MKFTARLRKIAKVTKWEQSQGKIVVKLIDKGYINKAIERICVNIARRNLTEKSRKDIILM